jgi:hypothetical protein
MGMFSEIATEVTIQGIIKDIEQKINSGNYTQEEINGMKEVGRFVLTQFEWETPDWAIEYKKKYE